MKKDFNKIVTSDIPLDETLIDSERIVKPKTTASKPKINAIGKSTSAKAKNSASKTTTSKTVAKKTTKFEKNRLIHRRVGCPHPTVIRKRCRREAEGS